MKKGVLFALLTAVLFATLEPVSKLIANDVNPYAITFWRFLIGSFLLLPPAIVKLKKEKINVTPKDFGIMALLGFLFVCLSMLSLQLAVKKAASPSIIAIIFSSNSVLTMVFAILFNREKFSVNKVLSLLFGVISFAVLCTNFKSGTSLSSVMLALFAAIAFSLYTIWGNKYSKKFGGIIQTAIVFFTGSIILLIMLLIAGIDVSLSFGPKMLLILCYLGFLVTGIGYLSYFTAIEKGGPIMASLAFFIKPILTPFTSFFINGIVPDASIYFSVICIIAASYFAARKRD